MSAIDKGSVYAFKQDRRGMTWDLLLYVPTVIALFSIAAKLWFTPNQSWSYLLVFLGSFFLLVGANRIVRTRLLLVPGSPVGLEVTKGRVCIRLRNGQSVDLVKDVRFYSEIGGKTFAITGMDLSGQKQQYVFHLGQFQDEAAYKSAKSYLEVYR
jgi:hypothetical protein